MKAALFGAAVATALVEDATQQAFFAFVKEYNKQYPTEEVFARYNTFKANLELIQQHNAGNSSWQMGINQFADLTGDEFKAYLGLHPNSYLRSENIAAWSKSPAADVDWVARGAVTPVVNQGQCGSSWAFAATGGVEGAVQIATGVLTAVSVQQLVDCAGSSGNQGCNGGVMDDAFKWIISNGGIASEASYPYTGRGDSPCKKVPSVSKISGYKDVKQGSEDALMSALQGQPVSIGIDASGFQTYKSGIFTGPCTTQVDHGALLVGAGTDNGVAYWRVKNQWGTSWGEAGYIRIGRTGRNLCGVATMASFPVA